ncbi:hypothetical protein BDR26DRAFT_853676 [Obelidium mucronatum]|nr:hypothetical protein BDR26DRAFT_853676 [Obelidium mucronatum]
MTFLALFLLLASTVPCECRPNTNPDPVVNPQKAPIPVLIPATATLPVNNNPPAQLVTPTFRILHPQKPVYVSARAVAQFPTESEHLPPSHLFGAKGVRGGGGSNSRVRRNPRSMPLANERESKWFRDAGLSVEMEAILKGE